MDSCGNLCPLCGATHVTLPFHELFGGFEGVTVFVVERLEICLLDHIHLLQCWVAKLTSRMFNCHFFWPQPFVVDPGFEPGTYSYEKRMTHPLVSLL